MTLRDRALPGRAVPRETACDHGSGRARAPGLARAGVQGRGARARAWAASASPPRPSSRRLSAQVALVVTVTERKSSPRGREAGRQTAGFTGLPLMVRMRPEQRAASQAAASRRRSVSGLLRCSAGAELRVDAHAGHHVRLGSVASRYHLERGARRRPRWPAAAELVPCMADAGLAAHDRCGAGRSGAVRLRRGLTWSEGRAARPRRPAPAELVPCMADGELARDRRRWRVDSARSP